MAGGTYQTWLMADDWWGSGLPVIGKDGMPQVGDAVICSMEGAQTDSRKGASAKRGQAQLALWQELVHRRVWLLNDAWLLLGGEQVGVNGRQAGQQVTAFGPSLLERAGIAVTAHEASRWTRLYRVPVFHLEALAITRIYPGARSNPPAHAAAVMPAASPGASPRAVRPAAPGGPPPSRGRDGDGGAEALMRRVACTAVRAIYAMGLDYGEAHIALDGGGRTAVHAIVPPAPAAGEQRLWAAALQRFAARHAAAREAAATGGAVLRIGADPEFVLLRQDGRVASAHRYLRVRGEAGCDAVRVGGRVAYPVAELRPPPASGPGELAAHVRQLLRRAQRRVLQAEAGGDGLRWLAGAMPVPGIALGGHIHVSGTWLSSRLLRLLDIYVAMPLSLIEDPAGRKRRPRFGALGDFREQPHGFEYRTLPSWLVSPMAAQAAFALVMLVAEEAWWLPHPDALQYEALAAAYYAEDQGQLRGLIPGIEATIKSMPTYGKYSKWLAPLWRVIAQGKVWDEQADFRHKWGMLPV